MRALYWTEWAEMSAEHRDLADVDVMALAAIIHHELEKDAEIAHLLGEHRLPVQPG